MLNPGIEARSAEKNIAWAAGPGTGPDASSAESAADLGAWVFASGIGVSVQHGMVFGALAISGAGIALASTAFTALDAWGIGYLSLQPRSLSDFTAKRLQDSARGGGLAEPWVSVSNRTALKEPKNNNRAARHVWFGENHAPILRSFRATHI
jgi:hypothetical protein